MAFHTVFPQSLSRVLAVACLGASFVAQADPVYVYTFLPSDPSLSYIPSDINKSGQIAGQVCEHYSTGGCSSTLYSGGRTTTFDPPGTTGSQALSISNGGTIVGFASVGTTTQGYVRTGNVSEVYDGVDSTFVVLSAVNDSGALGGSYRTGGTNHGFAQYTPGGPIIDFGARTNVSAINDANATLVVTARNGIATTQLVTGNVTAMIAAPNATSTYGLDINNAGQIIGVTASSATSGYDGSFLYSGGVYTTLDAPGPGLTLVSGINDYGQIVGYVQLDTNDVAASYRTFIATAVNLPITVTGTTVGYSFGVTAGRTVFIDPAYASGYEYKTGAGDPNFASVLLPVVTGDDLYELELPDGSIFTVAGGIVFDFTTHGFAGGVDHFKVTGIEASAAVDPFFDPDTPNPFVTGLTFVADGSFTGVQAASIPEPGTFVLLGAGVVVALLSRRRSRKASAVFF